MHGQVKTDKSDALKAKEKKQKDAKLKIYREGMAEIFEKRKAGILDWETMDRIRDVLAINPDVYTLWNIRKEILLHMIKQKLIDDASQVGVAELRLTESCLKINPKSYGAWHHRCWIVQHFSSLDLKLELALCNKYLKMDSRNFHCWDYRRFITSKLGLSIEEELSYTMEKIEENFSNYSSWHYRSKLLPLIYSDPAQIRPVKEDIHLQELELVQNAAFTDPNDQSAWFYLRWLLGRLKPKLEVVLAFICPETKKIYVGFNFETSMGDSNIKIHRESTTDWKPVSTNRESSLWVSDISDNSLEECRMEVTTENMTENVLLDKSNQYFWYKAPLFDPDVSPKLKAVLEDQLASCNQLLELEPNSKWPLLTSVVSMKAIDTTAFKLEIVHRLKVLMECDQYRSGYYADMMSKFVVEETLKSCQWSEEVFSLSGNSLTSLHHTQYLSHVKQLDLSANFFQRSLPKLIYAVNCEILLLDGNKLTSLKGLPPLPKVTFLSLADNEFEEYKQIFVCLGGLPSLQKINLQRNPFTRDAATTQSIINEIKALKPSVQVTV